jgi:hypothetical protein
LLYGQLLLKSRNFLLVPLFDLCLEQLDTYCKVNGYGLSENITQKLVCKILQMDSFKEYLQLVDEINVGN